MDLQGTLNRLWSIDESPPFPDTTFDCHIDLILKQSEEDLNIWPHSYELRLQVALSPTGDLILTSRIKNNNANGKPFQFSFAYHTYFSVSDISCIRIGIIKVDRLYLSAPPKIVTIDHEKKRTLVLRKKELPDVGAACIEKPITLRPGEEWQGRQEISSVPSSYSSGQLDPEIIRQMQRI